MLDTDTLAASPNLSPIKRTIETLIYSKAPLSGDSDAPRCLRDAAIADKVMMTRNIIMARPSLKRLGALGTSMDYIDVIAANEHGVNTHDIKGFGTSNSTPRSLMLMLPLAEHLLPNHKRLPHGD